jgi:DNA-binding NarL/FixJ family response regulator
MRVLIVDDHAVTRAGMRSVVGTIAGAEVVGEASTGAEAVVLCRELRPSIVLMDMQMPVMNGVEAAARIKGELPDVQLLMLGVADGDGSIMRAIEAGASGYLPKSATIEEIQRALHTVHDEGAYVSPSMLGALIASMAADRSDDRVIDLITTRERQVLDLMGAGLTARRIANELGISERTVNAHVGKIYRRMGVNNRVDALREAMRAGIVRI